MKGRLRFHGAIAHSVLSLNTSKMVFTPKACTKVLFIFPSYKIIGIFLSPKL